MSGGIRVLYVDDEPDLLELGKLFLEREGEFTVDTLTSAGMALSRLQTEKYDAIISDYQMPEIDGITFLKHLKTAGDPTPFIIFTGRGREEVVIEALNHGADFYMQKGGGSRAQFAELSNKIRYAVSRKKSEDALKESEERFRSVVNDQTEMIARFTPEGHITFVNNAYRSYLAAFLEIRDFQSLNIQDILQEKNFDRIEKFLRSLTQETPIREIERGFMAKDGSRRWQTWSVRALFSPEGNAAEYQVVGRDITDSINQKNIERELRRSEQRSLAVILNAGSWIWEVDPEGVYRYSSPAVEDILGYRPDELAGTLHFSDLFDPSVREVQKSTMIAAFARREPFRNMVMLNRHKNGTPVMVNTSATPVFDETGAFSGYCGVDVDITEQTATQTALQAIVKSIVGTTGLPSLRQITENLSSWLGADCVMIGEIQPDGEAVKVLSMLLDGKEVSDFVYTLKGTPCENVAEKGFCLYQDEVRKIFPGCRDLDELNIRGYVGTPLRNSSGRVFGILCVLSRNPLRPKPSLQEIIDIIAVKAAAEIEGMQMTRALQESEQKFRSLVEYSLDGILITDFQGRILFANNTIARVLELENPEGLLDRNVMEFVAPESRNDAIRDYQEVARGHDAYLAQYKVITAKGNEIYLESIGKVISYEGSVADLVSVHDVTKRKKAEDALTRSQHQLAEAMDMANLADWTYDVRTRMFSFDDRFYALYGTTAAREGGYQMTAEAYMREFVHPEDRWIVADAGKKVSEVTDPDYFSQWEHRIVRRDGEIRHIVVRIGVTLDAEGRLIRTHGANQDITERKKAELALHDAARYTRSLIEASLDALVTISPEGRITDVNTATERITGLSREHLIGTDFSDYFTDLEMAKEGYRNVFDQGTVLDYPLEIRHRDGTITPVMYNATVYRDESGTVQGVFAAARDITERRLAEKQIADNSRFLETLIDTLPLPVFYKDADGKYLGCNRPFEEYIGIGRDALVGKTVYDIAPKDLADIYHAADQALLKNPDSQHYEAQVQYADGIRHDVIYYKACYRDHTGTIGGIIGAFLDISRRKQMEEALRESEEKYRTIIEQMQDLFYRTDIHGKITMLSPSAARISGYSSTDDLIGRDVASVYTDPADREQLLAALREKGAVDSYPIRLNGPDGSIRYATTSSHFYRDAAGNILGVEGVIHDTTEQRRAEEALRTANKKLRILSSITRHDINNQLTVLMAYLKILRRMQSDSSFIEHFQKIDDTAQRIAAMIRFTKEYETVGVNAPVWQDCRTLVDTATRQASPGQVAVKNELPAGTDVFADPLIVKVLYNLIDNAIRYGGKITTIRFHEEDSGEMCRIICEDDGVGVPDGLKEAIFERGFGKNTGLGLALSREILDITGITIRETGSPGEGARFEIIVPKEVYRHGPER
jgi:PAS domain S-box-containing protein